MAHIVVVSSLQFAPVKAQKLADPSSISSSSGSSIISSTSCKNKKKAKLHFSLLTRAQSSESTSKPQQKVGGGNEQAPSTPSWAQPGSDEPPPWEAKAKQAASEPDFQVPFYVYLLSSCIVAIAAIGSIFEYFNKKPVFGVVFPDSPLYTPILGFFAITGFPTAAFLWFKSIELANKEARDQDREDGFLD